MLDVEGGSVGGWSRPVPPETGERTLRLTGHEELRVGVIVDVEFEACWSVCKLIDKVGVDYILGC